MRNIFILFTLLVCPLSAMGLQSPYMYNQRTYPQNPHVDPAVWERVSPYFLSDQHPAKPFLDQLFSSQRATLNKEAALQAGFILTEHQGQQATVLRHPQMPNYIIKVYFDTAVSGIPEWEHWIKRIEGAKAVQAAINKRKFGSLFVVPKKWIYPLPAEPSPPEGEYIRKNFILVADFIPILGTGENKWKYRMDMTRSNLRKLFTIVTDAGMYDSVRPNNVPWTYKKQLAFVDTEVYHQWPLDYHPMLEFINRNMKLYWQQLIAEQKQKKNLRKRTKKVQRINN